MTLGSAVRDALVVQSRVKTSERQEAPGEPGAGGVRRPTPGGRPGNQAIVYGSQRLMKEPAGDLLAEGEDNFTHGDGSGRQVCAR